MKYPRTYALLKAYGHSPFKAAEMILDTSRGDAHALSWIREIFQQRRAPQRLLHLNWGACHDWHQARAKLRFLKTTLYANFAYTDGQCEAVMNQLERHGFTVSCEPYIGNEILLRIGDAQ
jgi:hypothetical protein